jgi:transcriptional regulator GlxA family with amidase domain
MNRMDIQDRKEWRRLAEDAGYRAGGLAKILGISQRQLGRYTQTAFGRSTQNWLDQERLAIAPGLLSKTRSVKLAAFSVGFKQISHFSREFKL